MNRLILLASLVALIPACTVQFPDAGDRANGGCPTDETCSPATPHGLSFHTPLLANEEPDLFGQAPTPVAIGGKETVWVDRGGNPLELPWEARVAGEALEVASTSVGTVEEPDAKAIIGGRVMGSGYLRIVDPANGSLYDRALLTALPVDRIQLIPGGQQRFFGGSSGELVPDDAEVVWMGGKFDVGIALWSEGQRVADESMQLTTSSGVQAGSDLLHVTVAAAAGSHALTIRGGSMPDTTREIVVVSTIDELAALAPIPAAVISGQRERVCFQARNAGRFVAHLSWRFTVDGQLARADSWHPNCVQIETQATSGTVSVTALAGTLSATTLTLPVTAQ